MLLLLAPHGRQKPTIFRDLSLHSITALPPADLDHSPTAVPPSFEMSGHGTSLEIITDSLEAETSPGSR